MATAELSGIVAVSRAVVSAAAELVAGVERAMAGDGKVRTARDNAWDALQADRARARQRAEMDALIATLRADSAHARARVPAPPRERPQPRDLPPSPGRPPSRDLGVVVGTNRAVSR